MKILAIETSTMLGGAALLDDRTGLIAEIRLNVKSTHSERLMSAVDRMFADSDLSLDDIDVFAAAGGPGSFTGLRIGLSTVKGLSYATGKPFTLVPTLEAFAWNFPCSRIPVCLMLDARKSEVYASLFGWTKEGLERIIPEISIRPDELLDRLAGEVLFAGEGALLYRDKILDRLGERAVFAPAVKMVPSPANVAMLGLGKAKEGEFADIATASPFYIRKSEAEVKWKEKS